MSKQVCKCVRCVIHVKNSFRVFVCEFMCLCICVCVCACVCVYIYIHTCMHAYIHTCIVRVFMYIMCMDMRYKFMSLHILCKDRCVHIWYGFKHTCILRRPWIGRNTTSWRSSNRCAKRGSKRWNKQGRAMRLWQRRNDSKSSRKSSRLVVFRMNGMYVYICMCVYIYIHILTHTLVVEFTHT